MMRLTNEIYFDGVMPIIWQEEYSVWYLGTLNSIEEGLKNWHEYLKEKGEILIENPELADYTLGSDINYVLFYRSLTKLKYIEYMYDKKNKRKR